MNPTISFDILNTFDEIIHFCTTREGGVSMGDFSSFNISPFSGDTAKNVEKNIRILSARTSIPPENFVIPFQTHEDKICIVDEDFVALSKVEKQKALYGVDALITNQKDLCIGVSTADCVPILFFDTKQKVVAAVHAGWRGTQARLAEKTLQRMQNEFKSLPEDIYVLIGPSISGEVYEVGVELKNEFRKASFPIEMIFTERNNKLYLDLWEANRWLLSENGILPEHLQIAGICTYSHSDKFFSARKLGIKSGRMYSGIALKK